VMREPEPAMTQVMEAGSAVAPTLARSTERTDDVQRFEMLYKEHFAAIDAYARRRFAIRSDDVVAETFLIAWRRLDEVPKDALPWLYGVARRVVSDLRRSRRRQDAVAARLWTLGAREAPSVDPVEPDVLSALSRLGERDQELLLLVYWEDLEPSRAARALGCSRASVATRLWRAHRRLKAELDRMEVKR